jgi:hypothetical protein
MKTLPLINGRHGEYNKALKYCLSIEFQTPILTRIFERRGDKNGEEIYVKRRLMKSGNACYHSGQNVLSFNLLSKNSSIHVNLKIYRTVILQVVFEGCEIHCLSR